MARIAPSTQWTEVDGHDPVEITVLKITSIDGILYYTDDPDAVEVGRFVTVNGVPKIEVYDE